MNIHWPGDRCILCLKETSLSKEHVIPKALGGILTCQFLCKDCNSYLGSSVEAEAKTDPSIRIAIENLRSSIPDLANELTEDQDFISYGPGGANRGVVRSGEFQVKSGTREDGSLVQPTDDARGSIEKMLRRTDASDDVVREALREFDKGEEDERVKVVPGLEVVKWSIEKLEVDLSRSKLISPIIPLKIAYEFLALLMGTLIYREVQEMTELRTALLQNAENHSSFQVDRLNVSEYKPFHGICFEGNSPHPRILIRLFGWLAFRVHFKRLTFDGPSVAYTHYLDSGQDQFGEIPDNQDQEQVR